LRIYHRRFRWIIRRRSSWISLSFFVDYSRFSWITAVSCPLLSSSLFSSSSLFLSLLALLLLNIIGVNIAVVFVFKIAVFGALLYFPGIYQFGAG